MALIKGNLKSLVARIWKLPAWIFLLPAFLSLGWSHWKDAENERVKQRWTTRIEAIEATSKRTNLLLDNYNAREEKLSAQLSAAKARGGATDAQIQSFRAEKTRLEGQLVLINEQTRQTRVLLDQLKKDKAAGLFDER